MTNETRSALEPLSSRIWWGKEAGKSPLNMHTSSWRKAEWITHLNKAFVLPGHAMKTWGRLCLLHNPAIPSLDMPRVVKGFRTRSFLLHCWCLVHQWLGCSTARQKSWISFIHWHTIEYMCASGVPRHQGFSQAFTYTFFPYHKERYIFVLGTVRSNLYTPFYPRNCPKSENI